MWAPLNSGVGCLIMSVTVSNEVVTLAQTVFYVVSPLVTLLAVLVAYIALIKQTRPHILVQYHPSPQIQSFIDLVIENTGGGVAANVSFSQPLPVEYFGIEKPDKSTGAEILQDGLPTINSGQKFVFNGGQYGGLSSRLGNGLEIGVSYEYKNPIGIKRKRKEKCFLSTAHMKRMPTRISLEQAVVDALKGPNKTTLQNIQIELSNIAAEIQKISSK